ncbi:FG-GAP repeat domain protein [Sulfitobacter noctilucae]|uniref:CRTAC1 family protein n=1 Tax=Sulfitobacter noctilucae TaxID=1342302 RepID=UPI00046886AA|nr:CRTAC1 family protein [Sulfitobacter noctilucae]KIN65553.1 FG-GAP repeat domain protein [Sulfitobacter noctilucae]
MKQELICVFALLAHPAIAGDVIFEDRSSGLPEHIYAGGWEHFVGGGVAVFDCDGDSLPDLFAAGGESPAKLMRNRGDFTFQTAAVPELTGVTGAYPLDMDADGTIDLFVLRVGPNVVLRGGAKCTFTNVTEEWGIPTDYRWSTAFSAWWQADQARPHLAVGNYVNREDPEGPFEACDDNILLEPQQQEYEAKTLTPGFCALSLLAAQDASGQQRLRFSNDRHYYVSGGKEQMWDIAESRFLTDEDGWPDLSVWGMGIASRDITGDGRDEVVLTSMGDQLFQIAANGSYRAAPFSIGTYAHRPHTGGDGRPSTGWHAEFGDVNNDGLADLFIAKGNVDQMPGMATRDPNNLLMQQADGTFTEAAADAGIATLARSRGASLADFDGDGRLDLVVMNRRAPMELYRNATQETGSWVNIILLQEGGNRDAIGARVDVVVGDRLQSVQKLVGGGHAGGQALPLHFGLGAGVAAQVVVTWPDGTRSPHQVRAGTTTTLRKPD